MSEWRPAKCLNVLREQVDAAFPDRPQGADGMIGDARHQAEKSDHNPNRAGVVCAWDITTDARFTDSLAEQLRQLGEAKDGRVKYVIFKGRIAGPAVKGWQWRPYSGFSQHFDHIHLSVAAVAAQYDRADRWPVVFDHGGSKGTSAPITPPTPQEEDMPLSDADTQKVVDAVMRVLFHGGPGGAPLVATHGDMVTLLHGTKPDANGVTTHPNSLDSIAKAVGVKQ